MTTDYSVTWNEVKPLLEKRLESRGILPDDRIAFGEIGFALDAVWNDLYNKMSEDYGEGSE